MANPSTNLGLPLELIDRIVDELDGDSLFLSACARVCVSWRYPFQRRLFHTVRLDTKTACLNLRQTLVASSHLVPLVRVLHLVESRVLVRILVALGSVVLWNVHTLIIDTSPYHEGLLAVLPGLRKLRLISCTNYIESAPWMLNELVVEQPCRLETIAIEDLDRSTGKVQELVLNNLSQGHIVEDVVSVVLEWSFYISRAVPAKFLNSTPGLRELCLVIYPFRMETGESNQVRSFLV
jgi:hypothetical protein